MPTTPSCITCGKDFATVAGMRSHCNAKSHRANQYVCFSCDMAFVALAALESHLNSPKHANDSDYDSPAYGDGLGSDSDDVSETSSDYDDLYCHGCSRSFGDIEALHQHLNSSKHNWCFSCARDFNTPTALAQHQNSSVHNGRHFKCPFCQSMFKSPSSIALHIESGCHKKITRHHVTAAIHAMNIVPDISIKRIKGPVALPSTANSYIASEKSFNGSLYECFLCKRLFGTLVGLNKHLNSAAHDDDEFRCPKCKKEFKLVSGFVQHLESRCCGLAQTSEIENYFDELNGQFTRALKL
ncbi:hypothetical protein B0H34DRAFT_733337 [Crassisporium funariophilum]|nr:hypothetical protein B0H34DRAFT_733337 [Crassisporium funariophilum]